ncbi:MAG: hypothetical protein WDO13_02765 [Verrucomicrobiota bacterium]
MILASRLACSRAPNHHPDANRLCLRHGPLRPRGILGSTYQILQIILATGATVEVVGPVMERWRFNAVRFASLPYRLMGRGVAWPKSPFLLRACAREVDAAVRRIRPDIVFFPRLQRHRLLPTSSAPPSSGPTRRLAPWSTTTPGRSSRG